MVQGCGNEYTSTCWDDFTDDNIFLESRRCAFLPRIAASVRTQLFPGRKPLTETVGFQVKAGNSIRTGRPVAGTPPTIEHLC